MGAKNKVSQKLVFFQKSTLKFSNAAWKWTLVSQQNSVQVVTQTNNCLIIIVTELDKLVLYRNESREGELQYYDIVNIVNVRKNINVSRYSMFAGLLISVNKNQTKSL